MSQEKLSYWEETSSYFLFTTKIVKQLKIFLLPNIPDPVMLMDENIFSNFSFFKQIIRTKKTIYIRLRNIIVAADYKQNSFCYGAFQVILFIMTSKAKSVNKRSCRCYHRCSHQSGLSNLYDASWKISRYQQNLLKYARIVFLIIRQMY